MMCLKYFLRCYLFIVIYDIRYTSAYNFHRITKWTSHGTFMTPFSTQWNVPLHTCVDECIARAQCLAVLYTRSQRRCNMLDTHYLQAAETTGISLTIPGRVFIKKADMLITDETDHACQNCTSGKVCDKSSKSCNFEECPPLEVPNATVNGNRVKVGAVVWIVPNLGYMLNSGGSYPTCEDDGTWKNVPTTSLLDCGVPPTKLNADITDGNTFYGSRRTYVCKDGYDVINTAVDMTVTCTVHSSWTPAVFECLINCGVPPTESNADIDEGSTFYGSMRTYVCKDGYDVIDPAVAMTVTCTVDSIWSPAMFECLKNCGVPPTELNADIDEGSTFYGVKRTYVCKDGYDVINPDVDMTVTCIEPSWSPALFECLEKTCQESWIMIDNSCYKFETTPQTQASARNYCSSFNAHLVAMETKEENSALEAHLINNYDSEGDWWLGIEAEGDTWVFTHTRTPVPFTEWGPGEPNNVDATESCVETGYGYTAWNDVPCSYLRNVICEKMKQVYSPSS